MQISSEPQNLTKQGKYFLPEDFVKNYSPLNKADLIINIKTESAERDFFVEISKKIVKGFTGRSFIAMLNDYKIYRSLKSIKKYNGAITPDSILDFLSNKFSSDHLRKFEYSFQGRCLLKEEVNKDIIVDIGGGNSFSTIVPALFNFNNSRILSIDVVNQNSKSFYGIEYLNGDFIKADLPESFASVVSVISTLEHIGLGRWNDPLDPDGDIKTMREIRRILRKGGYCILTIPYGFPSVVFNLHRIYDDGRISMLTEGFEISLKEYSLSGRKAEKEESVGIKASKNIEGFYINVPENQRHFDSPAGIMLLLKKL